MLRKGLKPHGDVGNKWDSAKMVPSADLLERITTIHPTVAKVSDATNDTARSYRVPGYMGTFGFISSMSDHFCSTCNRLRITADGQIKVRHPLTILAPMVTHDSRCAYLTRKRSH
jgi:molybdenum cofactor biosynthesis enzyme MoaA